MTLTPTVIWLIAAAVLGIIELMASTFYLLVLAVAALVGSGFAFFDLPIEWQVVAFAVVAIVGSIWVRRLRSLATNNTSEAKSLQHLDEGKLVQVSHWQEGARTSVQYRGAQWEARAEDAEKLKTGLHRIIAVEGNVLVLQKV